MNLRLTEGALLIDASTLEGRFSKCPRQFHYSHNLRRTSIAPSAGRDFGAFFHKVLEDHYNGASPLFKQHWQTCCAGMPIDDFRNIGFGRTLYEKYVETYGKRESTFTVAKLATGALACECPFAIPLGVINDIPVIWEGKIDLVVDWIDNIALVVDHKTSSIGGDLLWADFQNSTAQHGYCWAAQKITGRKIDGFTINAIFTRVQTKTGKGCEFFRQRYPVSQARLDEFVENTLHIAASILDHAERDYWPMHTCACVHRFGKCEFLPVCECEKEQREVVLNSGLYKENTWTPLKR